MFINSYNEKIVAIFSGASGGICEKYKSYTENIGGRQVQTKRSLNTGIITFVNYNSRVPPKVSELTLAHEIGHNFGSPHDYPLDCRPGGSHGNFIMYSSATSGERPNNNKFSFCSINNISSVLHAVFNNEGKDNCFQEDNGPFCGNKIVEEGEECDCGYDIKECSEMCCYPREVEPFRALDPYAKVYVILILMPKIQSFFSAFFIIFYFSFRTNNFFLQK
jgi:disintegrin and metalloproteinase domain-containing protein 10